MRFGHRGRGHHKHTHFDNGDEFEPNENGRYELTPENDSVSFYGFDEGVDVAPNDGDDKIIGSQYRDYISGGRGDDKIAGAGGDDVINGNQGNDLIFGGRGDDLINGSSGNDMIFGGRDNDKILGGAGDDKLFGGQGHDKIYGEEGDDFIFGGKGTNRVDGGAGDDKIIASGGENVILFGVGNDKDTVFGFGNDDSLSFFDFANVSNITGSHHKLVVELDTGDELVLYTKFNASGMDIEDLSEHLSSKAYDAYQDFIA